MKRNIMLLFVSPFRSDKDKNYSISKYKGLYQNEDTIVDTTQTNESAIIYLCDKIGKLDGLFAFVSQEVMTKTTYCLNGKTHFEGFKALAAEYVKTPKNIIASDYDENRSVEESLEAVAQMVECIMNATKPMREAGDEIVLHADMTGGMRNASMMMLGIMRFLEYSDIKMGQVLYSNWQHRRETNWVENAKDVYNFFDLVAGAKEFKNFGSVKEIEAYYDRITDKSPELIDLLEAMKSFSQEIKLCRYGDMKETIKRLSLAISKFEESIAAKHSEKGASESNNLLFASMLATIKNEYLDILETDFDDLKIIRWCLEHGYLQQAMTLYTERVPEIIMKNGLIQETEKGTPLIDSSYQDYRKKDSGSRNYYIIANYKSNEDPYTQEVREALPKVYKKYFKERRRSPQNEEKAKEVLEAEAKSLLEEYNELEKPNKDEIIKPINSLNEALIDICNKQLKLEEIKRKYSIAYELIIKCKGKNNEEIEYEPSDIFLGELYRYYGENAPGNILIKALGIKFHGGYKARGRIIASLCKKSKGRKSKGKPDLRAAGDRVEAIAKAIDDYSWIKDQRNAANHARDQKSEVSIKDIEERIDEGVKHLETICKEKIR